MTNGPRATIGKITKVDLPRPRSRKALLEHPDYYTYREEVLDFLEEYEHGATPKKSTANHDDSPPPQKPAVAAE
ncbi:MAG: ABC transporter ATP-binding protein, partial [Pseudomonadota bacterium]